jgi:hypothetical protein
LGEESTLLPGLLVLGSPVKILDLPSALVVHARSGLPEFILVHYPGQMKAALVLQLSASIVLLSDSIEGADSQHRDVAGIH